MKLHAFFRPLCGIVFSAAVMSSPLQGADPPPVTPPELRTLLQQALFEEEATRDLEKAATGYETLLTRWGEQRRYAASALFRLAEVRRKQKRNDDAVKLYQRLLTEFPDQDPQARLSRENLAALGAKDAAPAKDTTLQPSASNEEAATLARVQKLAAESPDLLNQTELTSAANKGWTSVVKFLVEKKVRDNGDALREAAASGHMSVCQLLVEAAPPREQLDKAAAAAIAEVRPALLKMLLDKGASPSAFGWGSKESGTPLLTAALLWGNEEFIDLLLERKAEVNSPKAVTTPLFAAALRGNHKMVRRLLELGADPNAGGINPSGHAPARRSGVGGENPDSTNPFSTVPGSTPLHAALRAGSSDCLALLLKAGADVNLANQNGWTPLHLAAARGVGADVKALLAAGAKPEASPTALILAIKSLKSEPVNALLQAKADPNLETPLGTAVAQVAAIEDPKIRREMIDLLMESGADLEKCLTVLDAPGKIQVLRSHGYAKFAAKPEVSLVYADYAARSTLAKCSTIDETLPSLSTVLLRWNDRGGWGANSIPVPNWSELRLFRRDADGKMKETSMPVKPGANFPPLRCGDVIEVTAAASAPASAITQQGTVVQVSADPFAATEVESPPGLPVEVVAIFRDMQTARIKLTTAGGLTRDITLRGQLRTWNPLKNEAPLVPVSVLGDWCGALTTLYSGTAYVSILRPGESGEGLRLLATDGTLATLLPREGEGISLAAPAETEDKRYFPQFGFSASELQFGGLIPHIDSGHTLLRLLAELYSAPPPGTWAADAFKADGTPVDPATLADKLTNPKLRFRVLPHPDFSRIRVIHQDGGKNDYDLTKAAENLPANATGAEARKFDVALGSLDRVEIPVLPDATNKPWNALPEKVERLIGLAVSCRVSLDNQERDLRSVEVRWLPARWVDTPAGLLPIPAPVKKDGSVNLPVLTAAALTGTMFGGGYATTVDRGENHYDENRAGWLQENDRLIVYGRSGTDPFNNPGSPAKPIFPVNVTRLP